MKIKSQQPLQGRRLLIAVSGSIAAVKTPLLVSNLIKAGAEVKCLLTPSACKLVSPVALASISRNRCFLDEDQWSPLETRPLHIELAEWAELVVVAPLSASSLSRWNQGLAEGLLASVLIACECPIIAAAAMNTAMWSNSRVQKNWEELKKDSQVLCLDPSPGLLACDRNGEGRMVDPELISLAISSALLQVKKKGKLQTDWKGLKLLATAGPTLEGLDPARLITNRSSGRMGVIIAQVARFRGADVDLIHGPVTIPQAWLEGIKTHPIENTFEMRKALGELQSSANAVSMAAAVADLQIKGGQKTHKIEKQLLLSSLNNLEEVPDLLKELAANKPKNQILLGFSALTGEDEFIKKQGLKKLFEKGCDLLMANPIDRDGQGFEVNNNGGWLLGKDGMIHQLAVTSKLALAHELLDTIKSLLEVD